MLGCGRPFLLLLIINFLDLSLVSTSSSSSQNGTRPRAHPSGEDYENLYDFTTEPLGSSSTNSELPDPNPCNYDMCVEQEVTCAELREATGCLCPGLSSHFNPPSPPRLTYLTQQDGKGVVVRWCAPTSVVRHYIVSVHGDGKMMNKSITVEERKRSVVLEDVEAGAHICVRAHNNAGISAEDAQSCTKFQPENTESGLALKLGIIGGVVGLIMMLILGLLLWRYKTRQKSTARTKTEGVL